MELYHGSTKKKLDFLNPYFSTYGNYLKAYTTREIAIIKSHTLGSDITYYFGKIKSGEPYSLIERLPGAFEIMYSDPISIYKVDDSPFFDIDLGLECYVTDEEVLVLEEEVISNPLEELLKLSKEGKINIYRYPNKPRGFSLDNSDLLDRISKTGTFELILKRYKELLAYYPELLNEMNNRLMRKNSRFKGLDKSDIVKSINLSISRSNIDPTKEPFLKIKLDKFKKSYPIYFKEINLVEISRNKKVLIDKEI